MKRLLSHRVTKAGRDLTGAMAPLVAAAFLASAASALAGDVLLLDHAGKSFSRVDAATLAVKATAVLGADPTRIVSSPDGATIVVLCRGEGEDKYDGFRAKTKSQAIFADAATLKEKARVELGYGIGPAYWNAAGASLVVLAKGFPHTNPEKRQTATVVSIDRDGKARRVSLERAASDMVTSEDGAVAAVLTSRVEGPAQIVFVDLASGTAAAPVILLGEFKELLLAPDGETFYALSRGEPKGFGNVPGALAAFSFSKRQKTGELKLCAITAVGGFDRTGRLILGGRKAGEVKESRLYVVRGNAVEYDVPGPEFPRAFRFSSDGRSARVLGFPSAEVDFGDFSSPPAVTMRKYPGGDTTELTPDGRLALFPDFDGNGVSNLLIFDVDSGKKLKSFDTASFGARLGAGVAAAGATLASMDAGRRDAEAHGRSSYVYSIYGPKTDLPRGKPIVIRTDGKVAYVYDPFGSTVLRVDLEKLEKGARQPAGAGSRGLYLTGGGKTLLIATDRGLNAYDAFTFGEPVVTKTDGPADIAMGPGGEALLLAKGFVAVVDPVTGKVGAKATTWKEPAIGAFLP